MSKLLFKIVNFNPTEADLTKKRVEFRKESMGDIRISLMYVIMVYCMMLLEVSLNLVVISAWKIPSFCFCFWALPWGVSGKRCHKKWENPLCFWLPKNHFNTNLFFLLNWSILSLYLHLGITRHAKSREPGNLET